MRRQSSNPRRRLCDQSNYGADYLNGLAERVRYTGSAHHKKNPVEYGFSRMEPRPEKSICDVNRRLAPREAASLLKAGIQMCMMSEPDGTGFPKFIWAVNNEGEVFEAKTDRNGSGCYHGYPLDSEDEMSIVVQAEWRRRCQ
ncbi:hypothetical protein [Leptonema illini]|uniref:Uncharacterized protein n=1 Tax=Leptonema illini DSM 21528 TaxID=929563 RepID=H2CD80_9LEPT|nr:hypothetical protein [Leptonema illini]EHQ07556.1 hypothetical protein Lepil_2887 [Leptonema illini DSM 21528]